MEVGGEEAEASRGGVSGGGGAGDLIPSSTPARGGPAGTRACFEPGRVNREGERATGGERACSADGPGGPAWLRAGPSGPGGSFSFPFVLLCLIFFFSVLANCLGTK